MTNYWLKKPPELPEKEEILFFSDVLNITIEEKLKELLEVIDKAEVRRNRRIKIINKAVLERNFDVDSEYFWTMITEVQFAQDEQAHNWIKYWLRLYEMSSQIIVIHEPLYLENNKDFGVTQEEIEKAKSRPIEELIDGEIRYAGNKLLTCCPFHGEKTASFTIFTEDNHFYCFGCHVGGDAIDFIMKKKNTNLIEAVKELNRG